MGSEITNIINVLLIFFFIAWCLLNMQIKIAHIKFVIKKSKHLLFTPSLCNLSIIRTGDEKTYVSEVNFLLRCFGYVYSLFYLKNCNRYSVLRVVWCEIFVLQGVRIDWIWEPRGSTGCNFCHEWDWTSHTDNQCWLGLQQWALQKKEYEEKVSPSCQMI